LCLADIRTILAPTQLYAKASRPYFQRTTRLLHIVQCFLRVECLGNIYAMLAAGIICGEEKCVKSMKLVVDEAAIVGSSDEHTYEVQVEICAKRCRYHRLDFGRKATLHQHLARSPTLLPSYRQGLSPASIPRFKMQNHADLIRQIQALERQGRNRELNLYISRLHNLQLRSALMRHGIPIPPVPNV
jgi:hypothetical protein